MLHSEKYSSYMSDTIRKTREENKEIGSCFEKRIVLHTFTLVAAIYVYVYGNRLQTTCLPLLVLNFK